MAIPPTIHVQTHITHGEFEADVDEGIAEDILKLWRLDIATVHSCEGGIDARGRLNSRYISMPGWLDVVALLQSLPWIASAHMDLLGGFPRTTVRNHPRELAYASLAELDHQVEAAKGNTWHPPLKELSDYYHSLTTTKPDTSSVFPD